MPSPDDTTRSCVFCARPLANDDPPEHVIPKWMRRFRPKGTLFGHQPSIVVRGERRTPTTLPTFTAKAPELTTNVVCRDCNGHWMSDLEARASNLLPPMIEHGQGQSLTAEEHAFIAVWAIKTVMTWQTVEPDARAIPSADYRWLQAHQTPPPRTQVRIGRYVGTGLPFIGYCQENLFRPDTPEPTPHELAPHGHRSILTIGQLVFEVLGSGDDNPVTPRFPNATGPVLLDIWPGIGPSYWPPPNAFDDTRLLQFMDIPDDALPFPAP